MIRHGRTIQAAREIKRSTAVCKDFMTGCFVAIDVKSVLNNGW